MNLIAQTLLLTSRLNKFSKIYFGRPNAARARLSITLVAVSAMALTVATAQEIGRAHV